MNSAAPSALVTGASRGLGRAVALRLADDGFRVFLGGRNRIRLEEAAAKCHGTALPFDVTVEAEVEAACAAFMDSGPFPDLVVNSAGVFDLGLITETTSEVLSRNLDVNLRGAFHILRAVLPSMLDRGRGLIINIGSVSGRRAFPENGAYAASKFGLRGLHEVLLEEIRGSGVRATLVEPGAVDTPIWDGVDPDSRPELPNRTEMLEAGDVAGAVSFLAGLPLHVAVPVLQIQRA